MNQPNNPTNESFGTTPTCGGFCSLALSRKTMSSICPVEEVESPTKPLALLLVTKAILLFGFLGLFLGCQYLSTTNSKNGGANWTRADYDKGWMTAREQQKSEQSP